MMLLIEVENPIGYEVDKLFERLGREEMKYADRVVHHDKKRPRKIPVLCSAMRRLQSPIDEIQVRPRGKLYVTAIRKRQ